MMNDHRTNQLLRGKRIRVLIADDHPGIRIGLCELLSCSDDIEVIGSVVNGQEAVALASTLAPDVVVIDVSMPVMDGIEATRRLVATNPDLRVVTLTALRDRRDEAFRAGAAAHVLKDATPEELVSCIRAVASA